MLKLQRLEQSDEWHFVDNWPDALEEDFGEALEVWADGEDEKAQDLLRDVLTRYPDHVDGWHHLSLMLMNAGDDLLSYACTREAVRLGLEAIPEEFSWQTSLLEWGFLENRPFLRAYHKLGLHFWEEGDDGRAEEVFARLLSVSPNDNLGARYLLLPCLLAQRAWEQALDLVDRYSEDGAPDMPYGKTIALLGLGKDEQAKACLQAAMRDHPKVAAELLKSRHVRPPSRFPGAIARGGEDEAFEYWERNKTLWRKNSRAYKLLLALHPQS